MAQGKKSFIAYSDWSGMFQALPDDIAGKLIKHIFKYVNDENPTTEDFIINALFEQVKSTLKRDLVKWGEQREQRSLAGKKSAEQRATKTNERSTTVNEIQRNSTVSVNDNVTVSVNANVNVNEENTHDIFAKRLIESDLDKEAVEISTRKKVDEQLLKEFNANLTNQGKKYYHYSEYKKHLVNWIPKKPKIESDIGKKNNKPTAMDYLEINQLAKENIGDE